MESFSLNPRLEQIVRSYGVEEVYAFGSRAKEISACLRGETEWSSHAASDIDIGVRIKGKRLNASERVRLVTELEDLLGGRVDLVVLHEADPFLDAEIIRGELLYAEDLDRQARFEIYVLGRAGDLLPLKKERMRMIVEEGAR